MTSDPRVTSSSRTSRPDPLSKYRRRDTSGAALVTPKPTAWRSPTAASPKAVNVRGGYPSLEPPYLPLALLLGASLSLVLMTDALLHLLGRRWWVVGGLRMAGA